MIHGIIYDGVLKKAATQPPNDFIGNVEMAAAVGIILKEIGKEPDFSNIKEPKDIKEQFLSIIEEYGIENLSDTSKILVGQIQKFKIKKMVNETMEDLEILVRYQK